MSSQPEILPVEIVDDRLIRIASDLSAMAWRQMLSWRDSLGASLDTSIVDTKTSPNDLVTLADAQIESLVRGYLGQVRPRDLMVGEEGAPGLDPVEFFPLDFLRRLSCFDSEAGSLVDCSDERGAGMRLEWHVDPIDGTVNYVRGIEHYAFSVGVCEAAGAPVAEAAGAPGSESVGQNAGSADVGVGEGRWRVGLVASPGLNATWVAVGGCGAYRVEGLLGDRLSQGIREDTGSSTGRAAPAARQCPGRRLQGTPEGLSGRLLATGFAYTGDHRGPQLAKLVTLMDGYDDIRRCGSAAIDLCMLAEGKVNSYAERGLGIYDYAAGAVIAEESGASVHRGGSGGPTAAAESECEVRRLIATI